MAGGGGGWGIKKIKDPSVIQLKSNEPLLVLIRPPVIRQRHLHTFLDLSPPHQFVLCLNFGWKIIHSLNAWLNSLFFFSASARQTCAALMGRWMCGIFFIGGSWLLAHCSCFGAFIGYRRRSTFLKKVNYHCTWRGCGITIIIFLVALFLPLEAMKNHALHMTCMFVNRKIIKFCGMG